VQAKESLQEINHDSTSTDGSLPRIHLLIIACAAHRKQTADWFFQGTIFTEWKSDGSLLWLHGKRTLS
jgi:hypothetical protein